MGALESTFDESKEGMSKYEKQLELTEKKAEKLEDAVDKMREMVEKSAEETGEHSTQTEKWKEKLADAEKALAETRDTLEEMQSPLGELTSEISNQESELEALKDEYVNAYLEFGATSEECQELASRLSEVSGELENNRQRYEEATAAANDLANNGMQQVEDKSSSLGDMGSSIANGLGGAFGSIATSIVSGGGILEGINFVVQAIGSAMEAAHEFQMAFDEAQDNIVIATGAMGAELDNLRDAAKGAWMAIAGDAQIEEVGAIVGNINTRFGESGDAAEAAATQFGQYATTMGVSAAKAVNDVADVMQQWGLMTEDANANNQIAVGLLDELTKASQLADVSGSEICDMLVRQKAAFEEAGYSIEDAMGFMVQYRDAGGSVSDVGTALQTMTSKLTGKIDNMGYAWEVATRIMSGSKDTQEILQTQIGTTGVTIEEAFGKRRAQQLISTFQAMDGSTDEWTSKIVENGQAMTEAAAGTVQFKDAMDYLQKQMIHGNQEQKAKAAEMYDLWTNQIDGYEKTIVAYVQNEVRKNREAFTSAQTMSTGISKETGAAATSYENMANRANAAINSIPESKTFKVITEATSVLMHTDNKGNSTPVKGQTYRFARGYSSAMLIDNPTIFGVSGGQYLLGGDKGGAEVVVGEGHLLNMMTAAVERAFGYVPAGGNTTNNYAGATVNVYGAPGQDVRELAELVSRQINRQVNVRRSI